MSNFLSIILLFLGVTIYAQTDDISKKVEELKKHINNSEKGEKLKWKDSLLVVIEYNEAYEYEKELEKNLAFATSIDSINAIARLSRDLVYYKALRLGKHSEGVKVLDNYIEKKFNENKTRIEHLGEMHLYIADANYSLQKYDIAIEFLDKANNYFKKSKNKKRIAEVYKRIGNNKSGKGDFNGATKDIQKAISIFQELKDTLNIIDTKEAMAILYSQGNFFNEALKERQELLKFFPPYHHYYTPTYLNTASNYVDRNDPKNYLLQLKLAQQTLENNQFRYFYEPVVQVLLADAYALNDSLQKAKQYISYFENEKEVWNANTDYTMYLDAKINILFAEKKYTKALSLIQEKNKLLDNKQSFVEQYRTQKKLADIYGALGDQVSQNKHLVLYYKIKDSITNVQNITSLAYYQTLYETEKRDKKILAQEKDIALLDEKNKVRNQWFLFLAIFSILGITGFILYKNYKQKLQRRLAVEQLRTKISADLHDDVGSLLTGLSMQSELMAKQVPEAQKFKLERISKISKDAMLKMRDAVWAMDARKDNWQSLIDRMNEFATENLQTKDISYTLDVNKIELSKSMQGAVRQNLYLIFKEAIANVLKHSNATKVDVLIKKSKNNFIMHIADNGSSQKKLSNAGQGLTNMTLRATQLLGNLQYKNDEGFAITVSIPSS